MARSPKTLRIRIPPYSFPRNVWRTRIHEAVALRQSTSPVTYKADDRLEVEVVLYFDSVKLSFNDVDNRLKDVMDALQGKAGGLNARGALKPIVPNDNQIFRVVVEKRLATPQSRGKGHLIIRRLSSWRLVRMPKPRRTRVS